MDTVPNEGLEGRLDSFIGQAAQESNRFLITKDLDLSAIRRFKPGTHHGIMVVRLREPGRNALFQRIRQVFQTEDVESWKSWFIVISERKVRVWRP